MTESEKKIIKEKINRIKLKGIRLSVWFIVIIAILTALIEKQWIIFTVCLVILIPLAIYGIKLSSQVVDLEKQLHSSKFLNIEEDEKSYRKVTRLVIIALVYSLICLLIYLALEILPMYGVTISEWLYSINHFHIVTTTLLMLSLLYLMSLVETLRERYLETNHDLVSNDDEDVKS